METHPCILGKSIILRLEKTDCRKVSAENKSVVQLIYLFKYKEIMRKFVGMAIFAVVFSCQGYAQSTLSDILGNLASSKTSSSNSSKSSTTGGVLTSIFNNLIGKKQVSETSLAGTWVYSQPAVAFESENLLSKAGGKVVANTIQTKLGTALTKYGFKSTSTFTFGEDKSFTVKTSNRTVKGKYEVSGSTITFYSSLNRKVATANVALSGNDLQITFSANKLLTFAKYASALSTTSSTLQLVSKMAGNYTGMQLGVHLKKK